MFVAFATLFNTHFDKIIIADSPNSHNLVKSVHFIQILSIVLAILPIMLALSSMLLLSCYAQNCAGIIGSSLQAYHHFTI